MRAGVDSGGTFTDAVGADGSTHKLPSTPDDPARAVRDGAGRVEVGRLEVLAHGTTVATNALLEGTVARVALVTTEGFADVVEIGRQNRPSLYDPWRDRPPPLVAREDRLEVRERLDADGSVLVPHEAGTVPEVPDGVEAVAVCLLHADLDPRHEQEVAAELLGQGWDVTVSHEVSPEFREFERTVTTVVNAALRPVCGPYLAALHDTAEDVFAMTSAGGLVDLRRAASRPAELLLSGPAAGARAAAAVAVACGFPDAVGFDMGGTSTDVCLIRDGEPAMSHEHVVAGHPVRLPSVDIHTVGAGGGSIASIDAGGALLVGPRSAGAVPGPACYGRGGTEPTVTDADLVAGRIPPDATFPGLGTLDVDAARGALEGAGVDAEGVIAVVDATMVQALRVVSVERGVDPADLALVAFGGAGPLHACALAEDLGAAAVVVPAAAGVLSAVGLLTSDRRVDAVRTWPTPVDHRGLAAAMEEVAALAVSGLADDRDTAEGDVAVATWVDCRYEGQGHTVAVSSVEGFPAEHERLNGYRRDDAVEVIALRAAATLPAPATVAEVLRRWEGRWRGEEVVGPRVVAREDCTIWVPEGWVGTEGALGSLVLRRVEDRGTGR